MSIEDVADADDDIDAALEGLEDEVTRIYQPRQPQSVPPTRPPPTATQREPASTWPPPQPKARTSELRWREAEAEQLEWEVLWPEPEPTRRTSEPAWPEAEPTQRTSEPPWPEAEPTQRTSEPAWPEVEPTQRTSEPAWPEAEPAQRGPEPARPEPEPAQREPEPAWSPPEPTWPPPQLTWLKQPEPTPTRRRKGLTRRQTRALVRAVMVVVLATLVTMALMREPPMIPVTTPNVPLPTRRTASALLWGADPLATALRRTYMPSLTVRETSLGVDTDTTGLPLKVVPFGGISVGEPHRGRLYGGVQLPFNPELYTIRRPEYAYGSTHAVRHLQIALAKFRANSSYRGPLIVSDLSGPRGGYHWPHLSHQSGRDVDLWLPLRCDEQGVTLKGGDIRSGRIDFPSFAAARPAEIDWGASWELVKALVRTGQINGIFLARPNHRLLRQAALRDGLSPQEADEIIQGDQRTLAPLVRHVGGHDKHLHVRFRCADYERYCR